VQRSGDDEGKATARAVNAWNAQVADPGKKTSPGQLSLPTIK